ncbi:MAG TPA: MraY family glycosyltransferase [Bacteroidia bacterium]|jgi:UDP-GlcNAc:undecaprenyl-phosphate GlcNAc-1-phosphate transferase|nr:MraY family glycosyltransferase [Bacteroidia bacterium]
MEEKTYLFLIYTTYFIGTIVLSFLINGIFLKFASTLGIRNSSETIIRWSSTSKPSLGGISFYLIFLLSIICYSIFFREPHILLNKRLLGLLAAATLAFLMGLSDDAYNTRPFLKFLIQVSCALILIFTGTCINMFSNVILDQALTLFWVVGLMNSVNMLDNMDGITTIVSITVILSAILLIQLNNSSNHVNVFSLVGVMAALIGFLYFNWHPSKMFMGDTGSQFLGLFLAAMGITYFWNPVSTTETYIQSKHFFITLLTFAIPIIDTTTVVINRLTKGKSPFVGGKDHTTHSLFFMGLTEKRIAILYFGICMVSMFFNLLIVKYIENWGILHIILFTIYFLLLFWFLYAPARKHGQ